MKSTRTKAPLATTNQPRGAPVRVSLQLLSANNSKAHPPYAESGERKFWWTRLKQAFGTMSSDFVDASLHQLQAAARLPCDGISEIVVNAGLAMIEAAAPKDEIEAALAVQMACTHTAVMALLARVGNGHGVARDIARVVPATAELLKAYATEAEVLRRLRHSGHQYVQVEDVHVSDGGQAIIGNVKQVQSVEPAE
jgi:hypothetical protein